MPGRPDPSTHSARLGVFAVFALAGMMFATFASRIPQIKVILDLTPGELGLTLLGGTLGSVVGLPTAGWVAHRIGARRTVFAGTVVAAGGFVFVGVAVDVLQSRWLLVVALFVATFAIGIWDVAMNLEGATVERRLGRTVMPHFHAAFSRGTAAAALAGAAVTAGGIPILAHLLVVCSLSVAGAGWATRRFLPRRAESAAPADGAAPTPAGPGLASAWTEPRTLLIGVVVLVAAFTEGTANDWLAVALVEGHHLPEWAGVLGFATFLAAMTAGRLAGTRWLDRYGRVAVLRVLFVLAVVGALLVVFGGPGPAFAGAALWGIGASLGFPVGMSAGADEPERAAARVSVVSTIGYAAFLIGPPALGFLGDHVGVLRSLLLVGAGAVLALAVLPAVRRPAPSR